MLNRHPWRAAHVAWLVFWLALDLIWGGLIAAGGNTAGLQQAYMLILYPLGAVVLLLSWVGARTLRAFKRHSAEPS